MTASPVHLRGQHVRPASGRVDMGAAAQPRVRDLWTASFIANIGTWMQTVGAQWFLLGHNSSPAIIALVQAAVQPAGVPAYHPRRGSRRVRRPPPPAVRRAVSSRPRPAALLAALTLSDRLDPGPAARVHVHPRRGRRGPVARLPVVHPCLGAAPPTRRGRLAELARGQPRPRGRSRRRRSAGHDTRRRRPVRAERGAVSSCSRSRLGTCTVPAEQRQRSAGFLAGLEAGGRYVRNAPTVRRILLRLVLFAAPANILWALLPLLARNQLGMDAAGYGILLGAAGVGAVAGAIVPPASARSSARPSLLSPPASSLAAVCSH